MRFFLDTEFIESGPRAPIQLISIGLVTEDGNAFYGVNLDFNEADANPWVRENVFPRLFPSAQRWPLPKLRENVLAFVTKHLAEGDKPEFWGYYADYDWVVFCQIFGTMMDLPKGFPKYCRDIKQLADDLGNPKLPPQDKPEHHALNDARWNREAFNFLMGGANVKG